MKRLLSVLLSICIALAASSFAAGGAYASPPAPMAPDAFACAVSALLRSGADPAARLLVRSDTRIDPCGAETVLYSGGDLWVLQFRSAAAAQHALDVYAHQSFVQHAEIDRAAALEPNAGTSPAGISASPNRHTDYRHLSWGPSFLDMDRLIAGMTHGTTSAPARVVAILDSGIQSDHPFFAGRLLPSTVNTSASGAAGSAEDDNGHGTGVASVVVDTAPANVYVRAYKVLDQYTAGTLLSLIAGIRCAVADGVDVINMSLGFSETSEELQAALDEAHEQNILLVGAAGNKRTDAPLYPSSCNHVIRVSAVNENGEFAGFSNFGEIDLAAPGVNIKVASLGGDYQVVRGTSEAAPYVSAVAATLSAAHPCMTPDQLMTVIKACAVPPLYSSLVPEKYGAGVLQAPDLTDPAVRALILPYCGSADPSAYQAAVARAESITDFSPYEAVTVERLQAALAADVENMTACNQPDLDAITAEIHAAIDGLALWSPRTFKIETPRTKLHKYGSAQLTVSIRPVYARTKSVEWFSGNPDVVSVSSTGIVRFVSEGSANVFCRIQFDDNSVVVRNVQINCEMQPLDLLLTLFVDMIRYLLFPVRHATR